MKFFSWLWSLLPQKKQPEHLLETGAPETGVVRVVGRRDRWWLVKYACGHRDVRLFHLLFRGHVIEPSDSALARRERCGDCMLAHFKPLIIHCAWCDEPISPGNGISLCEPHPEMKGVQTVVETPYGPRVVGCLLIGCANSGDEYAGNWDGSGVRRPRDIPFGEGVEIRPDAQGELYPRINASAA
jgi:hypothetical protein